MGLIYWGISPTGVDTPAYTLTPYGLIMHLGDRFSPPPLGELEGALIVAIARDVGKKCND